MTLTPTQQAAIAATVQRMQLAKGLGDEESACSIAAINLALSGELTDEIPDCMSKVIGRWIIAIQDRMPDDMRNSSDWKRLLPLAAGTGRDHETKRLAMIMDWMWASLEAVQPVADAGGFGPEWAEMCSRRTAAAATSTAHTAAANAAANAAAAARAAAYATYAYAYATHPYAYAYAYAYATHPYAYAADSAYATHPYAYAYAYAADSAYATANATASWRAINPPALLERLIKL